MKIVICPLTRIVGPHVLRNILIEVNKKKRKNRNKSDDSNVSKISRKKEQIPHERQLRRRGSFCVKDLLREQVQCVQLDGDHFL